MLLLKDDVHTDAFTTVNSELFILITVATLTQHFFDGGE